MEDNTGSRESKKKSNTRSSKSKEKRMKSMEDNTRSSKSKKRRRKSMEDNTRSSKSKEKTRKSMEDNTRPTENLPYSSADLLEIVHPVYPALCIVKAGPASGYRCAGSSSPHVEPDQNIVLARAKPLGNHTAPMVPDEKIIEEEAVCEACSAILREDKNILRRKCKCSGIFIHETCVARGNNCGNNCGNCGQKVWTYPVTLVRGPSISTPMIKEAKSVSRRSRR